LEKLLFDVMIVVNYKIVYSNYGIFRIHSSAAQTYSKKSRVVM